MSGFAASLLVVAALGAAAYQRGPVSLSPEAQLSWDVDFAAEEISFALVVSNSALNTSGDAWIGIGIGEDTSGGMIGADIFTAEFAPGVLDNCTVKDRHVPFAAYPLTQAPGAYPEEDACQTDGSWTINSCVRDAEKGSIALDVTRPLKAVTAQDRAIAAGEQVLMYAHSAGSFSYHRKKRGGSRVVLFNADKTFPSATAPALPADVAANFSILATNFTVSPGTTYACTAAMIPVPQNQSWYMVAARPVLQAVQGSNMAHHFVVYLCQDRPFVRQFFETKKCDAFENDNPKSGCSIINVWAVGAVGMTLPDDVGFLVESNNAMLVIETHFDNPTNATGVDTSGTEFFFSTTRSVEAGTLVLGDFSVSLEDVPVRNGFNYTWTCPSNCTAKWPDVEISVFASGLHMHTTGRNIWTNKYNADGTFNETMNAIEYWSNDHQYGRFYDPPKTVRRGDILSTTCNYDTTKRPGTVFGERTVDEMCIDFVFYYPVQRFGAASSATISCGGVFVREWNYTASFCGPEAATGFNFERNPSFDDTVGLPATFGGAPATCALTAAPHNKSTTAEVTAEPNSSPEASPQATGAVCFPGSAVVRTRARGTVAMRELRLGDDVAVGNGAFSPVYMFTHRVTAGEFEFVELEAQSGEKLRLSAGHHLYAGGRLVAARDVRVGDVLVGEDGSEGRVVRTEKVYDTGLYNPQTLHGDIAVDGIVTSTYTEAIAPHVAHAALAPLRGANLLLGACLQVAEGDQWQVVKYARRRLAA